MKSFPAPALFLAGLLLAGVVHAAGYNGPPAPKYPEPPSMTFLYRVNITGGDVAIVGGSRVGFRMVVPIAEGSFTGPKLKGISSSLSWLP